MKRNTHWLQEWSFAHRGLHDSTRGIVENTAAAVGAAIRHGFGIEVDLRAAACGTVMVFHDDRLDRLTCTTGNIADHTREELQAIAFKSGTDKMLALDELLQQVGGRVPLLLEIKTNGKSNKSKNNYFMQRTIDMLKDYDGPFAIMSFDPSVIITCRKTAPDFIRGLISQTRIQPGSGEQFSWLARQSRRHLLSFPYSRPDFIAYDIDDLPALAPVIARKLFHKPLLSWTVRTRAQYLRAKKYCDAMIFEGFVPDHANGLLQ